MAETVEQKLKRLKGIFEEKSTTLARAEGSLQSDMERLKTEHGFSETTEAEAELATLQEKIEDLETALGEELETLEAALSVEP